MAFLWAIDIAYTPFLGLNILGWMGIVAFVLLAVSAVMQVFKRYSIRLRKLAAVWHRHVASAGLFAAFLHGLLALLAML